MNSIELVLMICLALKIEAYSNQNWTNLTECILPSFCRFQKVNRIIDASGIERILGKDKQGLLCDISEVSFSFNFDLSTIRNDLENETAKCSFRGDIEDGIVEIRWPKSDEKSMIFDERLNISSLLDFVFFFYSNFSINLVNIKRFGFNISNFDKSVWNYNIKRIYCSNCRFESLCDKNGYKVIKI